MRELCALLVLASALRLGERLGLRQFGRTAEGTMASGLETVGRDLTQLRQDINTDDREVDRVVNAQFTLSSPALTGALDTTLAAREQELLSLQTRIDYINTVLDTVIATCLSYSSCNSCTAQTTCIWCRSTSSCIAGNSLGGVGQYCDVFEHGECSLGCEQYTVCGACVTQACLWCSSSQSCLDQAGNCAVSVVRSREDENCSPQSFSGNGRYEARSAGNAVDLTALQRELREDQGRLSGLQRDIASLQGEESSVSAGFNSMAAQQISSVSVDNPLAGLGQIVDSTTRNQGNFPLRPGNYPATEDLWNGSGHCNQQLYSGILE